jgi:hypothetical protein
MKFTKVLLVVSLSLLSLSALDALAANPQPGTNTTSPTFIDENGNGICDNYENNGGKKGPDVSKGTGQNYVDANGDGVCDNTGTFQGNQKGYKNKGEVKPNFIDANGDGICDNAGTCPAYRNQGGKSLGGKPSLNK